MQAVLALAVLAFLTLAAAAEAQVGSKEKALEKYERTGELASCIPRAQIKETKILDDSSILFLAHGGRAYLNELPQPCGTLGPHRAIQYATSLDELCSTEIVTVIDPGSPVSNLGSCGLGQFELLKEKRRPGSD